MLTLSDFVADGTEWLRKGQKRLPGQSSRSHKRLWLNGNDVAPSTSVVPISWRRAAASAIVTIQQFANERITPFFDNKHQELTQEYRAGSIAEYNEAEQHAALWLKQTSWLAGYSVAAALLYPPLLFLAIPPIFYLMWPVFREARRSLVEDQRVNTAVLDSLMVLGTSLLWFVHPGYLVVGALGIWFHAATNKVVTATEDHTRQRLTNLFGEQPLTVWLVKDDFQIEVPFATVQAGDLIVIEAGQMIPVDGTIDEGAATINQHMLTGESQPVDKGPGDEVFASTVVLAGRVYVRVERTGEETVAAQIGQVLNEMADYRSSLQLRGQKISDQACSPTLALGVLALLLTGLNGMLAVLFSGVGYTMKILGPLSVLNFLQVTSRHGILIKDGRALEQIFTIDTVVFDKTGTLTLEQPHVGQIHVVDDIDASTLLTYAAAAEQRQDHPIARAICQAADEQGIVLPPISASAYKIGYGLQVTVEGHCVKVGSRRFMQMESITLSPQIETLADQGQAQGYSLVYVAVDGQLAGAIELHPTLRPEAHRVVQALQQRGLDLYIISGDHEMPTRSLASKLGIAHYFAETLPEEKASLIAQLQAEGRSVCFVGDGINDSVALKQAQMSVSLKGASTMATNTAQIILMDETLNQLDRLFELSEEFEANMKVNLATSVVPGMIIIIGAFMGVIGYAGAVLWFNLGMSAGLVNSLLPLIQRKKQQDLPPG